MSSPCGNNLLAPIATFTITCLIEAHKVISRTQSMQQLGKGAILSQDTFSWILSHKTYCSWRDNSSPSALLLHWRWHYDAQSVSRFLTASPDESRSGSGGEVVISFHFNNQEERRRTLAQLSLSLVQQLLGKLPDSPSHVRDFYDTHLIHSAWTGRELWDVFRSLPSCSWDRQIILIISSLQEWDERDLWVVEDLASLGSAVERRFKVLITVLGRRKSRRWTSNTLL